MPCSYSIIEAVMEIIVNKKLILFIFLGGLTLTGRGQILKPVQWSYAAKKISNTTAVVLLKATMKPGWHIYSQHLQAGGPVRTSFTFARSSGYSLIGQTREAKPLTRMESVFHMNVRYFERSVIFQQRIRLKMPGVTVKGTVEYMTCNDKQCLPPEDLAFSIPVK